MDCIELAVALYRVLWRAFENTTTTLYVLSWRKNFWQAERRITNFSRGICSVELTLVRLFIVYHFSNCFRGICHTYPWSATYARCVSECYSSTNSSVQNINLKCFKIHTKKLNIKKLTSFGLSVTILSEYKIMHKNCIYFLLKIRLFSVITLSEQSSELNYDSTLSITLKSMNDWHCITKIWCP